MAHAQPGTAQLAPPARLEARSTGAAAPPPAHTWPPSAAQPSSSRPTARRAQGVSTARPVRTEPCIRSWVGRARTHSMPGRLALLQTPAEQPLPSTLACCSSSVKPCSAAKSLTSCSRQMRAANQSRGAGPQALWQRSEAVHVRHANGTSLPAGRAVQHHSWQRAAAPAAPQPSPAWPSAAVSWAGAGSQSALLVSRENQMRAI